MGERKSWMCRWSGVWLPQSECLVLCLHLRFTASFSFFFSEQTVTGTAVLDMLTECLLPQLKEDSSDFIFQMDGAPPYFHRHVREFLNQHLPQQWIGRGTDDDQMILAWPPRSPDRTPCDFFLWGYVKDLVYVPPLPESIAELKVRITTAIETITAWHATNSLERTRLSCWCL